MQFSLGLVTQLVKNLPAMQETWVGKIPWRREWLPTPVFLPGEFHGLYSPWSHKELDTTEQLSSSGEENVILDKGSGKLFLTDWILKQSPE